jgi:hypothetical protein
LFLLFIPLTALAFMQSHTDDAVSNLQRRISAGETALEFDSSHGYLKSLLKNLDIPVSSQGLVFSKSSLQYQRISPATPRAIYFNDDTYVGFVQGGPVLEIISIDPRQGPLFYTLTQDKDAPRFERQTNQCLACHYYFDAKLGGPRLVVLSLLTNESGNDAGGTPLFTTDRSPLEFRWGGWYVTGTHGRQRHLGNMMVRATPGDNIDVVDYISHLDETAGSNVTDLSSRVNTKPYLTPHSDIVALLMLVHQANVHNLMTLADLKIKPDSPARLLQEVLEPLVEAMLFSGEAPLTDPIAGTSGYSDAFAGQGPRDRQGRSLRDLDMKRRLLRYPLSYLIYSKSFDEMPPAAKQYVYRRLREVLGGEDNRPEFAHLSEADRKAIAEILQDTKPDVFAR